MRRRKVFGALAAGLGAAVFGVESKSNAEATWVADAELAPADPRDVVTCVWVRGDGEDCYKVVLWPFVVDCEGRRESWSVMRDVEPEVASAVAVPPESVRADYRAVMTRTMAALRREESRPWVAAV